MMKLGGSCVVTGGAGFIGTRLLPDLCERFDKVVVVDNLHPQIHSESQPPKDLDARAELVVGDVARAETWDRVLAGGVPDVVVHLAAETGTGQSLTESTRHADVNVVGTTQMLDAFTRRSGAPKKIVLSSSRAVYGEGAWKARATGQAFYPPQRSSEQLARAEWDFAESEPLPHDARATTPHPTSIYGATKLTQEHILNAWGKSFGTDVSVLRFQNVYGPGQSLINSYTGIVTLFIRLASGGKSIPLYEDGKMQRDFVFIDDVAKSILAALANDGGLADPVDIGSGVPTTIEDVAIYVARRYKAPDPHVSGAYRNGDVRHAVASIAAAGEKLGWSPNVSVHEGLERLCQWFDAL